MASRTCRDQWINITDVNATMLLTMKDKQFMYSMRKDFHYLHHLGTEQKKVNIFIIIMFAEMHFKVYRKTVLFLTPFKAQNAWPQKSLGTWVWSRRYSHSGCGGETAMEGTTEVTSWYWSKKVRWRSLEMETTVSVLWCVSWHLESFSRWHHSSWGRFRWVSARKT